MVSRSKERKLNPSLYVEVTVRMSYGLVEFNGDFTITIYMKHNF